MDCPRDMVEMKDIVGRDDTTLSTCDSCGGVWVDSAELNRMLLHNNLSTLESMAGKANVDELAERCPKDQVDLLVIEGGDKSEPLSYAICEACGGIWLDLQAPEGANAEALEALVVGFFKKFKRGQARSVRP